jgi:lipopolysaccharide biosynthesis glycosyltransferase
MERNMSKIISISCASDHNYLCGLWVTLHSICKHCSPGHILHFHVLDCGLTADDICRLKVLETTFTHCTVKLQFHIVSFDVFKDAPIWRGNHATYARLLLQDILKDDDFTIYTDIDTLWLRDVATLWAMRSQEAVLWGATDGSGVKLLSSGEKRLADFKACGKTFQPQDYFCAGLVMLNLKRLREMRFTTLAMQSLKTFSSYLQFADQDLYNLLIQRDALQLLDFRWGEFAQVYGRRGLDHPAVIHYANCAPWKFKPTFATSLWWHYLCDEAGLSVFGHEAKKWQWRSIKFRIAYRLRRLWFLSCFARWLNRRSAKKNACSLNPTKYPLMQDECY